MNTNASPFLFIIFGIIMAEAGGLGFIIWSRKLRKPQVARNYGVFLCIMGIIALLLVIVGLYLIE